MASGRILKSQISLSEQVNDVSLHAALLFTWMITHADDFGRMRGSSRKVKAQVVPMRDEFTAAKVDTCLKELHKSKLIQIYTVNGEVYIQFPTWEEHQSGLHKRTKSKLPDPPSNDFPGNSGKFPAELEQNLTEQELEQNRTVGDAEEIEPEKSMEPPKPKSEFSEDFDLAFAEYPKRSGDNSKKKAFEAWNARLKSGSTVEQMHEGVIRYRFFNEAIGKIGTEFVKQASTFFGPNKFFLEPYLIPQKTGNIQAIRQEVQYIPKHLRNGSFGNEDFIDSTAKAI